MKKKSIKLISLFLSVILICTTLSSCSLRSLIFDFLDENIKHFEDWIKTTDDGYVYYFNENNEEGVYILDIPDTETVTIPEYIDDNKVVKLGHMDTGIGYMNDYRVVGTNTKQLTIQHPFISGTTSMREQLVDFPNLINLTFIDFLYCNQSYSETELIVPHYIGAKTANIPTVELRKSNREYSLENFNAKVIIIPDYVTVIEAGVFAGLEDVTIKTSYASQPQGWQDGWNGNCQVEYGVDISYMAFHDWFRTTDDQFTYYYNDKTTEGVYIINIPYRQQEVTIPEYIDGKKVLELGHFVEGEYDYSIRTRAREVKKLTVQHQFVANPNTVVFGHLTNLIFIDYLYCSIDSDDEVLIVPYFIGGDITYYREMEIPVVELRKSDRIFDLSTFKPKVIIIPEYVEIIDAGVFDGLTDVIIKTSYDSKPEGWQDGWNGNCQVEWGVEIN